MESTSITVEMKVEIKGPKNILEAVVGATDGDEALRKMQEFIDKNIQNVANFMNRGNVGEDDSDGDGGDGGGK